MLNRTALILTAALCPVQLLLCAYTPDSVLLCPVTQVFGFQEALAVVGLGIPVFASVGVCVAFNISAVLLMSPLPCTCT